ncbi:MAG: hypothetical protein AAB518_04125 [Patescibacteria group bacterium]
MSLTLDIGTKPAGLEVKTFGFIAGSHPVLLGDYEISIEDFLIAANYVLTNTDLDSNDPRLQFVKCIQSMREVEGYQPGRKRLSPSEPPVLLPQS